MFPLPLVVTVSHSRQLRAIIAAAHLGGALSILFAAIDPRLQMAGVGFLLLSLFLSWRPARDARLRGNRDGKLELWHDQQWRPAMVGDDSVILPFCTVLRIALDQPRLRRVLVILPDSLPDTDFRRLRVWLRWRGSHPATNSKAGEIPDQ